MCGIAGYLTPQPERAMLERAAGLLVHRGPDDAGIYLGEGVGLTARRLSIIDVAGGHQPVSNEDGRIWVVQNGEIVNAPELRAELLQAGHQFRTQSDTEVLAHAFEEWGDDFLARLRGMFALAVWDARRQRLLIARDRFGIKPLFYAAQGGRFAFASEIRPLFDLLPDLPREADRTHLWQLFEIGCPAGDRTAFQGVAKLAPAHYLVLEDGRQAVHSFWSLDFPAAGDFSSSDFDSAAEGLLERLRDAVSAWRLSDVPVGALLSGGIDSATLAALLTELHGEPIETFTLVFRDQGQDETAAARRTSQALGSRHHEIPFTDADFDLLPAIVERSESPLCSLTSISLAILYRACRDAGFKVILTGEGADELLGGYAWFNGDRRLRPLMRFPISLRRLAAKQPLPMSEGARRLLVSEAIDPVSRYLAWQSCLAEPERAALFSGRGDSLFPILVDQLGSELQGRHPFHQFVRLETATRMQDSINRRVDRMSMMFSVEARPPFMDHLLWEYCAALPPEMNLNRNGHKLLLRAAMRRITGLPEEVLMRPKKPLMAPQARWWWSKRLPDWAESCLTPQALEGNGYFDAAVLQRLRGEHQSKKANHGRVLNGVLTTQLWHERVLRQ